MLILAIIGFGMLIGWLAQLALGMGSKPNGQSLIAGLAGSFVGGTLASLIIDGDLDIHASGLHRFLPRRDHRARDLARGGEPLLRSRSGVPGPCTHRAGGLLTPIVREPRR